jgi:peptide subunit release factor RF-3
LAAADNAVMLVDAGKGLEPQTRKLFEVSNEIAILLPRVLEFLRAPF